MCSEVVFAAQPSVKAAQWNLLSESGASTRGSKSVCDLIYESREPAGEETNNVNLLYTSTDF